MPRIARVVIPDIPHHIIQRGNRRQPVFFSDDDRKAYLDYLCLHAKPAGINIWAYCLMDNHVHLIAVPKQSSSFADGFEKFIGLLEKISGRMLHRRKSGPKKRNDR